MDKVVNLANSSGIRCIIHTFTSSDKKEYLPEIYAFKPGYFDDAVFMMFIHHIHHDVLNSKRLLIDFFGESYKLPLSKHHYYINNPYTYGKTLGYLEKYIRNFYIYVQHKDNQINRKEAIKIYNLDKKMYPIIRKKIEGFSFYKSMAEYHIKNIKKIPKSKDLK